MASAMVVRSRTSLADSATLAKTVAAEFAAPALHDAVALELEQDLLEELARDLLLGGNLADHERFRTRQRDKGVEGVFGFL